jgi:hypothetical protein
VLGFKHCLCLFYACFCGVMHMCVSNVMVLLYGTSYIVRVYVRIRNYIRLGITFLFLLIEDISSVKVFVVLICI